MVNHQKICRLKFSIISIKPGITCTSVVLGLKREMESCAGSFELKALSMEQCFEWLFFNFMHFEGVFCDLRVAEPERYKRSFNNHLNGIGVITYCKRN